MTTLLELIELNDDIKELVTCAKRYRYLRDVMSRAETSAIGVTWYFRVDGRTPETLDKAIDDMLLQEV